MTFSAWRRRLSNPGEVATIAIVRFGSRPGHNLAGWLDPKRHPILTKHLIFSGQRQAAAEALRLCVTVSTKHIAI